MKKLIKQVPGVHFVARRIYQTWQRSPAPFVGSEAYWNSRYDSGGNSGDGSYNILAAFKAEVLNNFVADHGIKTVMEFGCGDGAQLQLANYPHYFGFDVSGTAVERCKTLFSGDHTKAFYSLAEYTGQSAELSLSLDVLYHLIEDEVFESYLTRLFRSAERFVIIYSSNTEYNSPGQASHVKHRNFTQWIDSKQPRWSLLQHIPNRYPFRGDTATGSFADFYVYQVASDAG